MDFEGFFLCFFLFIGKILIQVTHNLIVQYTHAIFNNTLHHSLLRVNSDKTLGIWRDRHQVDVKKLDELLIHSSNLGGGVIMRQFLKTRKVTFKI